MSIMSVVYVPEGIAIAADSRLTLTKTFECDVVQYMNSDNSQKLFSLSKVNVGISSCGDAIIENNTIADFIRKFEIESVKVCDTVEKVSCKLKKYLSKHPANTEFFVCGYTSDIPYVYTVTQSLVVRNNVSSGNCVLYGANWLGQKEAANKLLSADSGAKYIFHLMPLKDAAEFAEYVVDLTIKYEKFTDGLKTCGGSTDVLIITKDDMTFYRHKIYNPW
jgi:hypothetical protein